MPKIGVWADDSVMEKSDRIQQSKQSDEEIHFADLMSIASIKHFEVPWKRKYKGRVVFCGGQVRNQYGGAAKFGQLYFNSNKHPGSECSDSFWSFVEQRHQGC